uniref:Caspase n=1 Tax=Rhipicephalus appendiculatus TaxID=34631 RepID=A0A131YZ70_RHIAP
MAGMSGDDVQAMQACDEEASTNSELDARRINEGNSGTQSASSYPVLKTPLKAERYNMSNSKHGKCVIFNYENFDALSKRTGTNVDAKNLEDCFSSLHFETVQHKDLTVRKTKETLGNLGKNIDESDDCFVCCVLTHGTGDHLYGKDGKFSVNDLIKPFLGDVCPNLRGKPKLFFIQACRGDRLDSGTQAVLDTADSPNRIYRIPTHADILAAYSTVPGFYSWRNTMQGSWFIQALCSVLQDRAHFADVLSMLTVVCRRVALDYESYTPNDLHMHRKKQVPFITSTLTRQVYFRAKPGAAYS